MRLPFGDFATQNRQCSVARAVLEGRCRDDSTHQHGLSNSLLNGPADAVHGM